MTFDWLVHDKESLRLGTLNKGIEYHIQVDVFNEHGITPGNTIKIEE